MKNKQDALNTKETISIVIGITLVILFVFSPALTFVQSSLHSTHESAATAHHDITAKAK